MRNEGMEQKDYSIVVGIDKEDVMVNGKTFSYGRGCGRAR